MSRVKIDTGGFKPNLLIVVDGDPVQLHYNLNLLSEDTPKVLINLGNKDVDIVAEECRIRLKDKGMRNLKLVLETIELIRGE